MARKGKNTKTQSPGIDVFEPNEYFDYENDPQSVFVPRRGPKPLFIKVDDWVPEPQDKVFRTMVGAIILPVSDYFKIEQSNEYDCFMMTSKRAYNNPKMRNHICQYLNYFEKFYDRDHELVAIYSTLKYFIDNEPSYNKDAFFYDLDRYIMHGSIRVKSAFMNSDNYSLSLAYRNKKAPSLAYNNKHGKQLMLLSLLMNMIIPLLCHFMYVKKITDSTNFLLEIYDILMHLFPDTDLYNKLYETCISIVQTNVKRHSGIWAMQDIRGISPTTHAQQCVQNIILNIIPKYIYNQHLIHFNISSVQKNTGFQITDIEYEFNYVNLSSSKRDEDLNSEFDKFESFLIKTDEALYLQNKVNCESAMQVLDLMYGQPGDEQEIDFYLKSLSSDGTVAVNSFQKDLVFNLFYKFFGDVNSINSINLRDYIKLIIYARRILEMSGMVLLPYLISSKITRLATRKSINKKEMVKITSSPLYSQIQAKYRNEKVEKHILSIIAIAMSSDFKAIDPFDNEVNGKMISIVPELLIEEVLLYITLI